MGFTHSLVTQLFTTRSSKVDAFQSYFGILFGFYMVTAHNDHPSY